MITACAAALGCGDDAQPNPADAAPRVPDANEPPVDDTDAAPPMIDAAAAADAAAADAQDTANLCAESDVRCLDDIILDLSLHDDRTAQGEVTSTQDGTDWVSVVDATAGGFGQSNEHAFIYLRFEDTGLVKVDIDDETALASSNWHIAARRFIVRVNSGVSGPSCVGAAMFPDTPYEELTEVPAGTVFSKDAFYDDTCTIVDDNSGLPGSPNVALSGWWSYTSCVTTTGTPALIQLNDGRTVRLLIETYYGTGQEACNTKGTPGGASGTLTLRWQFVGEVKP